MLNNYLRRGCYVFTRRIVCFFASLLATLRRNCWSDIHENFNFTRDVFIDSEVSIYFW